MPKPSRKREAPSETLADTRSDGKPPTRRHKATTLAALSLRRLFKAVFVDQLRLRQEGQRLKIALESAHPPAADTPPVAAVESRAVQMQRALSDLLNTRPDSRLVLKHLAVLEHHLKQRDDPFLHELSLASLQLMLRQLHGLIAPPPSPSMALLLAELLDAAELKTRLEPAESRPHAISSFFVDHKLEVKELSPSTLDLLGDVEPWPAGQGSVS